MPTKMRTEPLEKTYIPLYFLEVLFVALNVYYFCYGWWANMGLSNEYVDIVLSHIADLDIFRSQYTLKFYTIGLILLTNAIRHEEVVKTPWTVILILLAAGLVLFFLPYLYSPSFYVLSTVLGFALTHFGLELLIRKSFGKEENLNDENETFDQNRKPVDTIYAINIPFRFQFKGKKHNGYIPVPIPFAGCLVLGLPGSGKSYSIYTPFIQQTIERGYTVFCYDYKFPELTTQVYNEFELHKQDYLDKYGKIPKFCVVNYEDPRYSMRINPLHPRYLLSPSDSVETSDLIMKNVSPEARHSSGGNQFFVDSAKSYIDSNIWGLRVEQDGRYCTFPHLIEMLGRDYRLVFEWLGQVEETKSKIEFFASSLSGGAMEQLEGQIASARAPLMRFASKELYWVLSGDDIDLNLNDPKNPSILCVGNDPKKQTIYGTTNALIVSRMFSQINSPGRLPCVVLLDEFPTIFVNDVDNIIATARSRLVAIVLGAQDKQQVVRDYGREHADVIFNTVSNIFSGRLNNESARDMSNMFGKEYREQHSRTTGGEHTTTSTSQHQVEIMPASRISSLSQGFFLGKVADGKVGQAPKVTIKKKLFCGEVLVDDEHYANVTYKGKHLPIQNDRDFHLTEIEQRMRANKKQSILNFLEENLRKKEKEDSLKVPVGQYTFAVPQYFVDETKRLYDNMTDEERLNTLEKAIDNAQRKEVDKVLWKNYLQIKQDVNNIFLAHGINPNQRRETDKNIP